MPSDSATPLAKKLGFKADHHVALIGAPPGFESSLEALPAGVDFVSTLDPGPIDLVIAFVRSREGLAEVFPKVVPCLRDNAGLWIAWPKRSSGVATNLTEDVVREIGLANGLVDNKVCSIDETWSGLRFVFRLRDRKK